MAAIEPGRRAARSRTLVPYALLAGFTLALFADVLFTTRHVVLSNRDADLFLEYFDWLTFGFTELRRGHLALWNPYLFSGTPFFGGFQSALLYPLNALFLILPIDRAINVSIALHVFLAGAFTYAWISRRGFRPAAACVGGAIYMWCGANILHVYAGHFPILCTLPWAPLVFLAIDGMIEAPSPGWALLGMAAAAMEVLAGGPQYVFYTGVAAAVYCALSVPTSPHWRRSLVGLAAIALGGIALSAVQLFTSVPEWREMVRSGGAPYAAAASYSFPPENFLTLLAPHFFGDMRAAQYWGRGNLWEMCLFIGVTGLALAAAGAAWGERRTRRICLAMIALLLVLALGGHTPLFALVYHLPGFNEFRGNSKFIFAASLFLAMLAASGADAIARGRRPGRRWAAAAAAGGLILLAAAAVVASSGGGAGWWHAVLLSARSTGEAYLVPAAAYDDPKFFLETAGVAARSLAIGGVTLAAVGLLFFLIRTRPAAVWLLLGLAVLELGVFARTSLDHFDLADTADPPMERFLATHQGDYRILNLATRPDEALSLRAQEIWGYNPGVLKRYSQLVGFTQGIPPDQATEFVRFTRDHRLLAMLRCRFLFLVQNNQVTVQESPEILPRALLVSKYRLLGDRDAALSALMDESFDPRDEVILETPPIPAPAGAAAPGSVHVVESSGDALTIEADVSSPAILLVTDNYAKGWRARPLPGSTQTRYEVVPGNYCLRAIPLAAGHHRLRLEYVPLGFPAGKWVSIASLGVFLGALGVVVVRRRRGEPPIAPSPRESAA